ncbi:MAG: hypothetical protein E5V65_09070 [Mesorhizobium sp.]|nr:MAG: hypothetical protein E5W06_10490 [Mesorhizobium sp.]TIW20086.1 MAG: hypothetical protein E5V65_09070 [Mesorhizobium sp.]
MGMARSTYYDQPETAVDDTALVVIRSPAASKLTATPHADGASQSGIVVKQKRLMREHVLQPRIRPRFIATTNSDYELPIFPTWRST